MTETLPQWQFFGREDELDWLVRHCAWDADRPSGQRGRRPFLILRGERMVGKTNLLWQAQHLWEKRTPIIYLNASTLEAVTHFHGKLEQALQEQSLQDMLADPDGDYGRNRRVHEKWNGSAGPLSWCLERLVRRGVTIMLDDIHSALQNGWLDSMLRFLAHRLDGHSGPGTLLLCGLHLPPRLPMPQLDRVPSLTLRPLPPSTIMNMARQMGVLDRPEEVLTAWSFMGGMASLWDRSFDDYDLDRSLWDRSATERDQSVDPRDRATLDWARRERKDNDMYNDSNFHNYALLALGELIWDIERLGARLARQPVPDRQLTARDRQLLQRLHDNDNGQFLTRRWRLNGYRGRTGQRGVWEIDSIPALWQLRLFPDHMDNADHETPDSSHLDGSVRRQLPILIRHETDCLARMVAAWLGEQEGAGWHVHHACAPGARGTPIDAMARFGPKGQRQLVVAQCRRRSRDLDPLELRRRVELFRAAHRRREGRRNWPVHMLFVAPSISSHDRTRLAMSGGKPLELADMDTRTWHPIPR